MTAKPLRWLSGGLLAALCLLFLADAALGAVARNYRVPAAESANPAGSLHRFDLQVLKDAEAPDLAVILEWFWKYYDNPNRIRRGPLNLLGAFLRQGEGVEFELEVRSTPSGASYLATVGQERVYRLQVTARADSDELSLELAEGTPGEKPGEGRRLVAPLRVSE